MKDDDIECAMITWQKSDGKLERVLDKVGQALGPVPTDARKKAAGHVELNIHRWFWTWAEGACTTLVTGHKYAAALMCTDAGDAFELSLPWPALRFRVPDGLLAGEGYSYKWIYLIDAWEGLPAMFTISEDQIGRNNARSAARHSCGANIACVLWPEDEEGFTAKVFAAHPLDDEFADSDEIKHADLKERFVVLARRFTIGMLQSVIHTNNFSTRVGTGPRSVGSREPPKHRVIMVGKPLKIDARAQVKRWLETDHTHRKHAPPALQRLVRGHYKRQVIGVGRAGRKVIWIEPYWRGPEDAPILTRPYHVGA